MKIFENKTITFGVCYYPEHWDKSMWKDDLKRMISVGITVIRIAEFSWNKVEPREGEVTFEFWDEFLDLCDEVGMKVIMGTPTATPPAWLSDKYPEVLNCDIDGHPFYHGSRRHYNYNSPVYRDKCRIITEAFAGHYASRNCIVGWQIDNELNCEVGVFYSESDNSVFRRWVREKYGNLDELNQAWGTVFWNQTYNTWDEVNIPRRNCNGAHNPHLLLDYFRFISDSCRSFAGEQSDILRKYIKPGDFITTNGMFGHLDNHALAKESLDVYMYDSYPNFTNRVGSKPSEGDLKDRYWSRWLAQTRSVSPIFGIMEQQTGANGWNIWPGVPTPRPGQIGLWTLQSIAHGADFVSYFRWRTCTFGTEMYWHGILDYSGMDNERLSEVKETIAKVSKLKGLTGSTYCADVAVLKDYDNIFDEEVDKWHGSIAAKSEDALFYALQKTHTCFDYVFFYEGGLSAKLKKYKVLFYPHPVITDKDRVDALREYVEQGGTLILGARAGQKDMCGRCTTDTLPGLFKELTGTYVKEYSFIQPDKETIGIDFEGKKLRAELFTDRMSVETDCSCLGFYEEDWFAGDAAIVKNRVGKGCVYYFGSAFNEDAVRAFLDKTGTAETYSTVITVPESVELAVRGKFMFILNYLNKKQTVTFKVPVKDAFSDERFEGETVIDAYGYMVVRMPEQGE